MGRLPTLVLIFLSLGLHAQQAIQLSSRMDGSPIGGATITHIESAEIFITDQNGQAQVKGILPTQIVIRHLGFETTTYWLDASENITEIKLAPTQQLLDEVVVTGQFAAQSAKKSVYKVKTIDDQRIQAQAANTLQDVLSNELNIRFSRDNATGVAGMSLQGISGQNVKVLIDGIPMVGRSGVANEIDLNQINVNNIERIEIVEGPMAVNYGADALAGVINIITKKGGGEKLSLNVNLQEETVGDEYSLFEDGIHNAGVNLGYQINENWYIQGETRINRFGGWTGDGEGRDKSWYPKTQHFNTGMLRYANDALDIYYRLDHLDETIENLGPINDNNPLRDPFAVDEEYIASRWMHQLQADIDLGKGQWSNAISYTDYERNTHQFTRNMVTDDITTNVPDEQDTIGYTSLFLRSILANADLFSLGNWTANSQLGIESIRELASGTTLSDGDKVIWNNALFASLEFQKGALSIRPGVRFTQNSVFDAEPTASINMKYDVSPSTQVRFGYGRGFRAPSARELYHEFIDANHNILGNQDLLPEYSHNLNADITIQSSKLNSSFSIAGYYNHIDNRIAFFIPEQANQPTTYTNLNLFKTTNATVSWKYQIGNLTTNAGMSYMGIYQQLSAEGSSDVPTYVFTPEINANIQYLWSLPGINVSAFYKYTGRAQNYQLISDGEGNSTPELRGVDPFNFLDLTISKEWVKGLTLGIGARNLLDVTSVNNNIAGGEAHSGGGDNTPVAYGRSYFAKVTYQFVKQ
ncbi:MAG: TonB-dependent receptor [Bacteroidota bacterium]